MAWVEEAREVGLAVEGNGTGRRKGGASEVDPGLDDIAIELEALVPSALELDGFLRSMAQHQEEGASPASRKDMVSLLRPFALEDAAVAGLSSEGELGSVSLPLPLRSPDDHPYDVLLDRLRHPSSAEIVKLLQQFVENFRDMVRTPGVTGAAAGGAFHAFFGRTLLSLRAHSLWRGDTEEDWEATAESLERLVVHKIYDSAWPSTLSPDLDVSLSTRLRSLSFLSPEHLDLPALNLSTNDESTDVGQCWIEAENLLRAMDEMRCPGDKLYCMRQCLQYLTRILSAAHGGSLPGADEYLPALILLVQRSNPSRLHSNLEFVQCFREPTRLHRGEAGYALTQILSALNFLENMDARALTIRPEDFEKGLEESRSKAQRDVEAHAAEVREEGRRMGAMGADISFDTEDSFKTRKAPFARVPDPPPVILEPVSIAEVHKQRRLSASTQLLSSKSAGRHESASFVSLSHADDAIQEATAPAVRQLQLKFDGISAVDLRVVDLPEMVQEHHRIAKLCEVLLQERSSRRTARPIRRGV